MSVRWSDLSDFDKATYEEYGKAALAASPDKEKIAQILAQNHLDSVNQLGEQIQKLTAQISADKEKIAKLTKALKEGIELSRLAVLPSIPDPMISAEISRLCHAYGYGNVMSTAAALWNEEEPDCGHATTCAPLVHKRFIKQAAAALAEVGRQEKP